MRALFLRRGLRYMVMINARTREIHSTALLALLVAPLRMTNGSCHLCYRVTLSGTKWSRMGPPSVALYLGDLSTSCCSLAMLPSNTSLKMTQSTQGDTKGYPTFWSSFMYSCEYFIVPLPNFLSKKLLSSVSSRDKKGKFKELNLRRIFVVII